MQLSEQVNPLILPELPIHQLYKPARDYHPGYQPYLHRVPVVGQSVDALSFEHHEPMLIIVHLLDEEVLAGFEVHDMDVEVVVLSLRIRAKGQS